MSGPITGPGCSPNGDRIYSSGYVQTDPMTGWRCPCCSRCFAPSVTKCDTCGPVTFTTTQTNCDPGFSLNYCWRHSNFHAGTRGCEYCSPVTVPADQSTAP